MKQRELIFSLLAGCVGLVTCLLFIYTQESSRIEPIETSSNFDELQIVMEPEETSAASSSTEDGEGAKLLQVDQREQDPRDIVAVPSSAASVKVGVHASSRAELLYAEERLSAEFDYVAVHIHWANENNFPQALSEYFSDTGKVVVVFWNPMDYKKEVQDEFSYASILAGDWDDYISLFKAQVADHVGQVYIIPFEEINGEWTPWSVTEGGYGDLDEYKAAFRYLRNKFRDVPNVKFGWVVNSRSVPDSRENSIKNYYPGDNYVDFIGVNGFNFGDPWMSFDSIFSGVISELRAYNKPLYITSVATAEGSQKSEWVRDFLSHPIITNGLVKGWFWFNEDKERDWRFWSDGETEAVFREYFGR